MSTDSLPPPFPVARAKSGQHPASDSRLSGPVALGAQLGDVGSFTMN
jgi:hypothetical protein